MGRILGLDVGSRTVGVAVSDLFGWTAQGVEIIQINEDEKEFGIDRMKELVAKYEPTGFVLGLPKNMNGTEGPAAEKCRAFGEMIGKFLDIEQVYSDERLTTVQAQRTLIGANVSRKKRKNVVDKLAAQLILQNYLDAQGVMR